MGRFLAIDHGNKRVGLALSDPMKIIAKPFRTLTFTDASEFEGERIIKTTFDLSMKGYLLPESFNSIVNTQKEYSKRIGLELGVE